MKENYFTSNFIQKWQKKLPGKRFEFSFEKSALLIIDMQKYFAENGCDAYVPSSLYIIENLVKLSELFKKKCLPVILTRHIDDEKKHPMMRKWWDSPIKEEDPQSKIIKEFDFLKDYPLFIKKNYYDGFKETGLLQILKGRGIEKVLIGGVLTNCCCETTARSAFMNNFEVFFLFDGTATYRKDFHESTILNISYGFGQICFSRDFLENNSSYSKGEANNNLEETRKD